jgi:hypothetical protein
LKRKAKNIPLPVKTSVETISENVEDDHPSSSFMLSISELTSSVAHLSTTVLEQSNIIKNQQVKIQHLEETIEKMKCSSVSSRAVLPTTSSFEKITCRNAAVILPPKRPTSFAVAVKKPKHQIHLQPPQTSAPSRLSPSEVMNVQRKIEASVSPLNESFVINKIRSARKGGVVLDFETKVDCDNPFKSLNEKSTTLGFQPREIKLRPRLLVRKIPAPLSPDEIHNCIIVNNEPLATLLAAESSDLKVITTLK